MASNEMSQRQSALESALEQKGQLTEVPDEERGCGSLDHDSVYLRSDVSAFGAVDGSIPAFVTFDQPVAYREGHFRTFKRINGTEYILHVAEGDSAATAEIPEGEIVSHVDRAREDASDYRGSIDALRSMDLLMHVGKSYYPTPEDFVAEARTQGVSKKIPVSGNQEPPRIRPFRTRLFLIHPRAIPTGMDEDGEQVVFDPTDDETRELADEHGLPLADEPEDDDDEPSDNGAVEWMDQEFVPGVIGYSYLTRAVHTADVSGEHPEWAYEFEDSGLMHNVSIGEFVAADEDEHPQSDESAPEGDEDAAEDEDDVSPTGDEEPSGEPVSVQASDAEGRDVETVPDDDAAEDDDDEREAALREIPHQNLRSKAAEYDVSEQLGENPTKDALVEALLGTDIEVSQQ